MDTLWGELVRRGLKDGDNIAIISEEDTYYARALRSTFNLLSHPKVHSYTYLRGIDGKLPLKDKDEKETKTETEDDDRVARKPLLHPTEGTEGPSQVDDIRRLAAMIRSLDAKMREEHHHGFRAIGLLGSDVYDKLEILKALRPMFPEAVFFTNNLDARFGHPDEWNETHNMVVVSARGLSLDDPDREIQRVAPFRDSGQTALFEATLRSMGMISAESDYIPKSPLIFEITHDGPKDLSPVTESISTQRFWDALKIYIVGMSAVFALGGLVLVWIYLVSRVTFTSSVQRAQTASEIGQISSERVNCVEAA